MGKRLFVGGLAYSVTNEELQDLFGKIGEVASAQVIADKFSNQSKGFGFVEMVNDEDADKAIAQLNDTEFAGRNIAVTEARPKTDRSFGSGGGNGGGFRGQRGGGGGGGYDRNGGGQRRSW
jgi:RNA recognition motif-containing protein